MNTRTQLTIKYNGYLQQGHLLLGVTLSSFVKSDGYAHSDLTRYLWDHHFIHRIKRHLPPGAPLDHDYVLEPHPNWHYHGIIAVKSEHAHRLWSDNKLNKRLHNDVKSFEKAEPYRPFPINSFDIAPVKNVEAWCRYITKQPGSVVSSRMPQLGIVRLLN